MLSTHCGELDGRGLRVALVVSRFNEIVTDRLLSGALDRLSRLGVGDDGLFVARVPGAFEIPLAARAIGQAQHPDAVVCLGALVRGQTSHFDVLAAQVTSALGGLALELGIPVGLGVLTCETLEQAMDRAGGKAGNKGAEAAETAVEMARLLRQLTTPAGKRA